ncbi:hypothetical protein ACOMHN_031073 [Nucella lapillus]
MVKRTHNYHRDVLETQQNPEQELTSNLPPLSVKVTFRGDRGWTQGVACRDHGPWVIHSDQRPGRQFTASRQSDYRTAGCLMERHVLNDSFERNGDGSFQAIGLGSSDVLVLKDWAQQACLHILSCRLRRSVNTAGQEVSLRPLPFPPPPNPCT